MKEELEQDRQTGDAGRGRRKRAIETGCHVFMLLIGSLYVVAFLAAIRTGYLSWIGIGVGLLLTIPGVVSPVLGLAGRRRLSTVLTQVSVALTFLTALILQVSLLRTKRDDTGNWRPYRFDNELAAIEARRAVPDSENAAHHHEWAFREMDLNDEPDFVFRGSSLRREFGGHPWKGSDHPQAAAWLDSQSTMIDRLLEIGRMKECRWPVQADTYDEYTVPYRKLRRSVLLLIAAGNRDLGEGRVTEALTKYLSTLRIADHLHQQPSQVDCLTSLGCERNGLRMIRHVLAQSSLSDEEIARIASHLPPTADPWPQEWERLREHDKLHYMNLLARLYEVNDEGSVRLAKKIVISPKDERQRRDPTRIPRVYWLMSMPRDPHAVRGIVDRYFAKVERSVGSECPPRMDRREPPTRASLNDFIKAMCNPHRWGLEMFFFNEREYMRHRQRRTPAITHRRGTWLVLGLRLYRNAHGTWPQTLDAITDYIPAEAFFDPTAGGAFMYRLDGDNFRLYSKGLNRIDDDGRQGYVRALNKVEDDIWLWPPPAPEPEPSEEEIRKQLEQMYGKEYVETYFKKDGSDKR